MKPAITKEQKDGYRMFFVNNNPITDGKIPKAVLAALHQEVLGGEAKKLSKERYGKTSRFSKMGKQTVESTAEIEQDAKLEPDEGIIKKLLKLKKRC